MTGKTEKIADSTDEQPAPKEPCVSLKERFEFGNLTIAEMRELSKNSHTKIYSDIKNGLLLVEKFGRSTRVRGPIARLYLAGEPMPTATSEAA